MTDIVNQYRRYSTCLGREVFPYKRTVLRMEESGITSKVLLKEYLFDKRRSDNMRPRRIHSKEAETGYSGHENTPVYS